MIFTGYMEATPTPEAPEEKLIWSEEFNTLNLAT